MSSEKLIFLIVFVLDKFTFSVFISSKFIWHENTESKFIAQIKEV